ncbi:MAG: phospholipid scramblase-related protein [Pseudomonadota bacterium]
MIYKKKTTCPHCHKDLPEFGLTALLSINRCQECNLAWFDRGELSSWFQRDELELIASARGDLNENSEQISNIAKHPPGYTCPRCDKGLALFPVPLKDQTIYRCLACLGHLITMDGLQRLKACKATYSKPLERPLTPERKLDLNPILDLREHGHILIKQRREIVEFMGIETRNKYDIYGTNSKAIAFVEEQGKSALSIIFRNIFGHWREFQFHIFSPDGTPLLIVNHPFKLFMPRLELRTFDGREIGSVNQKISLLSKKFTLSTLENPEDLTMDSPLWRPWQFTFYRKKKEVALLQKKFSGLFHEIFTDKDNFALSFYDTQLTQEERLLILASALLIDITSFENNEGFRLGRKKFGWQ